MSWVALGGALVSREDAKVSVYDRGFLYGDSIFETLRTYDGKLFRLGEHLGRFARSAKITKMSEGMSVGDLGVELERMTCSVLEAARASLERDESVELTVRLMLTRGEGPLGLLPTSLGPPTRVTFFERFRAPNPALYESGAKVLLVPTHRPSDAARGAKVGNYLESLLCLSQARDRGADEALVIDAGGHVVEGATSNVFIVRGGALVTPPESSGLLAGITRSVTLDLARELGIETREETLFPGDFADADEAFLTSTLREIMPIGRVEGAEGERRLAAGPVTARLRRAFAEATGRVSS